MIDALIFDHADNASLGTVDASGYLLPVELTSFSAEAKAASRSVLLRWKTATESGNLGFTIERMPDARAGGSRVWSEIGFVEGHGTSAAPHEYAFTDRVAEGSYAYRLKQIDQDGAFRYSDVRQLNMTAPRFFALEQNYPNPFNPSTTFEFSLPEKSAVTLAVYDIYGRRVTVVVSEELSAGTHTQHWNAEGLTSGMYFYRLQAGSASITRRLLLLK